MRALIGHSTNPKKATYGLQIVEMDNLADLVSVGSRNVGRDFFEHPSAHASRAGRAPSDLSYLVNLFIDKQMLDTTTSQGKLLSAVTGAFAEFERDVVV